MSVERIAASYVYALDAEPIRNGYVEYDDRGTVISIGRCEDRKSVV